VLGAGGRWSAVRWGEKMMLVLALRLLFPHTTLELVLNSVVKFEFSVADYFFIKSNAGQQHGNSQQKQTTLKPNHQYIVLTKSDILV
jgi:hypothetical protein